MDEWYHKCLYEHYRVQHIVWSEPEEVSVETIHCENQRRHWHGHQQQNKGRVWRLFVQVTRSSRGLGASIIEIGSSWAGRQSSTLLSDFVLYLRRYGKLSVRLVLVVTTVLHSLLTTTMNASKTSDVAMASSPKHVSLCRCRKHPLL